MRSLTLEDFDLPAEPAQLPGAASDLVVGTQGEADRMATYEEGYQAGWDDAARARSEDDAKTAAEFAHALQELSLTFHEARSHVMQSMEPLLDALVSTLMPALTAEVMAATIRETLQPMMQDCADAPIELVVAPGGARLLEAPALEFAATAISVVEETTLASGQAYLRLGKTERNIDLTSTLETIKAAMAALYDFNERTLQDG